MRPAAGKTETYVGYGILLLLLIIAIGIFFTQFQYNSAILAPGAVQPDRSSHAISRDRPSLDLRTLVAEGMVPLAGPEFFGPDNLSDKIDGKAELYLSAGFTGLLTQRFAVAGDTGVWMEIFIYDMESGRNAFAVYSMQRRFEAVQVDLSDFGYRTENALFFVHGRYYVEVISSTVQSTMADLMLSFGRNFVREATVSHEAITEVTLFPAENLNRESISLLIADGFGFERFDSIVTAQYTLGETELSAFLSQRISAAEAIELAEGYRHFLLANGGTEVDSVPGIPLGRMVEIMETFDVVFVHGTVLAGVHGAESREAAVRLAHMLNQKLVEVGK